MKKPGGSRDVNRGEEGQSKRSPISETGMGPVDREEQVCGGGLRTPEGRGVDLVEEGGKRR